MTNRSPAAAKSAPTLKPQDVLVLLKIVVLENAPAKPLWKLETLKETLSLSLSEVHAALGRARAARLLTSDRRVDRRALEEFAIHGAKYAFPAALGAPTRGVPTAHAAPAFRDLFVAGEEAAQPVWPVILLERIDRLARGAA